MLPANHHHIKTSAPVQNLKAFNFIPTRKTVTNITNALTERWHWKPALMAFSSTVKDPYTIIATTTGLPIAANVFTNVSHRFVTSLTDFLFFILKSFSHSGSSSRTRIHLRVCFRSFQTIQRMWHFLLPLRLWRGRRGWMRKGISLRRSFSFLQLARSPSGHRLRTRK